MIKSKLKLVDETPEDPSTAVAAAIVEAARRTDASNKALIEAIKTLIIPAPKVQVIHHETQVPTTAGDRPRKWVFTVARDADGLMTSITAEAR